MSGNRVVVSTNSTRCYAWYAPLTCLAWKHIAGFRPTVLCVGDGIDPIILAKIGEAGGDIIQVPLTPGYDAAGQAQMCRLYACADSLCSNDYLMTTDVDAWPLTARPFVPSGKALDVYMTRWPVLPIGYIGAPAANWRAFMGVNAGSVGEAMAQGLKDPSITTSFNEDEGLVTHKIGAWLYPGQAVNVFQVLGRLQGDSRCHLVYRPGNEYATDRVWFGNWPNPIPQGMTDAHLCSRNSHPTWEQLRGLLLYAHCSPDVVAWADRYHDEVPSW